MRIIHGNLRYPWQIYLLKHGLVSLSHAMYGFKPNHLYFVPLPALGTGLARAQTSKNVSRKCLSFPVRSATIGPQPH